MFCFISWLHLKWISSKFSQQGSYFHDNQRGVTTLSSFIIIRVFVSLLLEESLSTYCPAMSIFGNMAPVWTYSLFKVIPPTSFWMTPRPLVVMWVPLCHMFGPLVVFQSWDMPYPSVLVGANLVDDINDTCLGADPACTFSIVQC